MFKKSAFLTLLSFPFFAQSELNFALNVNAETVAEWKTPLNSDEYPTSLALSLSYQTVLRIELAEASFNDESASFTVNMYLSQEEEESLIASAKVEGAWNETVTVQSNIDSETQIELIASLQNN